MQVCFDSQYTIRGCIIQDYLLEQSRITFQSQGERNYHVFYQLVAQGQTNADFLKTYKLRSPEHYKYLNASDIFEVDIKQESNKFENLTMALTVLQIPQHSIDGILKVLSAILWLGNLKFADVDGERCELDKNDNGICLIIAELLGLQETDIIQVLLRRQINVRGNITEIPLKLQEVRLQTHKLV